ncbi:MAG: DUF1850 domain-containing protein [Geminicoccaceae bacterium]|nr:DUF1850 domain-containing protein [Geminicoccaceae bacterium]
MRRTARLAGLAAAAASFAAARAEAVCPGELVLRARPAGVELARVALDPEGGFALAFRHSVTLRTVVERYRIEEGGIVQVEQIFDAHGPGLPDTDGPGLRFLREGERFRVLMRRPIARLLLRLDPTAENRLLAGSELELATLGASALELAPAPCPGGP